MTDDDITTELLEGVKLLEEVEHFSMIHPGDTAVFSTVDLVTRDQLERIRDDLRAKLPGVTVVVVSRVRFEATYRPASVDTIEIEWTPDEVDEASA